MDKQQRDEAIKEHQAEMIFLYTQLYKELRDKTSGLYAKLDKWDYISLTQRRRLQAFEKELKGSINTFNSKATKELSKRLTEEYKRVFKETKNLLPKDKKKLVKMKSDKEIKQDLEAPWSGLNHVERLEKNNMLIAYKVKEQVVQSARAEEDIKDLNNRIVKGIGNAEYSIAMLTETEMAYAGYIAFKSVVEQAKIEKLQYHVSGHPRACKHCIANDGKVFIVGTELPLPRHPNCGCWYEMLY